MNWTFPRSEIWSRARDNGTICDDFVRDRNIYGEIIRGSGNPKKAKISL